MQLTRGYISALIVTTGPNSYQDQQLQQWAWANNPPLQVTTSNQIFNVTWSVTGSGSKFIDTSSGNHMHTSSLAWTESGSLLVQLQVRMSASNQLIIDNSGNPIVLASGLRGTQQNIDDGVVTTTQLSAPVNGLPLPAVAWTGQQSARRLPDGSEQPTLASATFATKNRLGSLLGQTLPLGNSYFGSQQLPNPNPGGTQYAGATSTATWSWRLYY